jgi:hypothetical protein
MIELTLLQSEKEVLSGIPEYIEFETSEVSDVYYTLDGTVPSDSSFLADGRVYMPTTLGSVTVKAIAISSLSVSAILEYEFFTNSTNLSSPRRIGDEGVIVMLSNSESEESLSLNSDGYAAQELRSESMSYDLKGSETDSQGLGLSGGKTSFSFVNKIAKVLTQDSFGTSSPNNNIYFDPKAKLVYMSGFSTGDLENQVVKIVNRTYNSFEPTSAYYEERRHRSDPLVTGNYVRSYYNPKTGKYVSFYWESLESKWIISEQAVEPQPSSGYPSSKSRFVFRWIQERGSSSTFL